MEKFFPSENEGTAGICAHVAQLVEHVLGKDEVTGSIPVVGSIFVCGQDKRNGRLQNGKQ